MYARSLALMIAFGSLTAWAGFNVTGNPATDGFEFKGAGLAPGNYVRSGSGGVFSFNIYAHEFQVAPTDVFATMPNAWGVGDRVVMLGGVMTPGVTANSLGWSTNPANTVLNPANQRVNGKFGVLAADNVYSPSPNAPPVSGGSAGLGSHSGGNGGNGSVLFSIGAGRMITANAGLLLTPSTALGDNVAQFYNGVNSGAGFGAQGLDLDNAMGLYELSRFIFQVDGAGRLLSWELFLNTSLLGQYVSPENGLGTLTAPTGGRNWIVTVSNGAGANSDSLAATNIYSVPVPPTMALAGLGSLGVVVIRRVRRRTIA
jgi:hypothetical protein